jgi:ankyrin repeat protein
LRAAFFLSCNEEVVSKSRAEHNRYDRRFAAVKSGPSVLMRWKVHATFVACVLTPSLSFAQAMGAPAPAAPAPAAETLAPAAAALQDQQDRLQTAIVKRDAQAVRAFIRSGMNLNFNFNDLLPRGRTYATPLNMAIGLDRLEIARLLLEGGADVRRKDADGRSPIHYAKSVEAVRLLVEFGADLDAQNATGRTAVVEAVERGDVRLLDMLVANGARINAPINGRDLFARAIEFRHPEMIGPLLERGADPRSPPTQALWLLIESGDIERVRLLIQARADVNARNDRDWLLTRALFRQRWEIAEALIDAGAAVQLPEPQACGSSFTDCPSIQLARLASFNPQVLAKLKAKGLDLDAVGKDGHTALTSLIVERPIAVKAVGSLARGIAAPDNVARSKAILDLGANANRKYRDMTPLMLAIRLSHNPREMAEMLLPFGARIEFEASIPRPEPDKPSVVGADSSQLILNHQGVFTGMKLGPLSWAMLYGRPDIALRLIQRDKSVMPADRDVLYFAALMRHWDLVVGALAYTKEVNAADRADVTPLMLAAYAGHLDAVRALLATGANVNVRSARNWPPLLETNVLTSLAGHQSKPALVGGYTALRAARERGHHEVSQMLIAAGGKE